MNSSLSSECWRCTYSPGDFIHVFWSCPAIKLYWTQVLSVINDLLGISVSPSPQMSVVSGGGIGTQSGRKDPDRATPVLCQENYYLVLEEIGSTLLLPMEVARQYYNTLV